MSPKPRERRFPISLPLIKEIRLNLWAHTRGRSKTAMAEAIIIDRVSAACNWREVVADLKQEAAINQMTTEELIVQILEEDGYKEVLPNLEQINWSVLVEDGEDPEVEESDA